MICIVITGNPMSGFTYYGPFANRAVAHAWANDILGANDWWIAPLSDMDEVS
jgi:hypothetical protein